LFLFQNKNPPKLKACCRPKPHRSSCGGAFLDPSGNIVLHPAADAGVFPDYPAPVVRNAGDDRELIMMRWGNAAAAAHGRTASYEHPEHFLAALAGLAEA
jgi:hypothetical protein